MSFENVLELEIGRLLVSRGWHLACAESCTGGLISHRVTQIPGSSDYFLGGVIAYANSVKENLLGVSKNTLEKQGAVSQETVQEMAAGVRQALNAEVGLSISGIAGPSGGSALKPVGTIWIGLSTPEGLWTREITARGDRSENKESGAQAALEFLYQHLSNAEADGKKQSSQGVQPLEPVRVTARFTDDGKIILRHFSHANRKIVVDSIGRQWEDEYGKHILVMDSQRNTYHLVLLPHTGEWALKRRYTNQRFTS
jgi:PncC family amidohydrolase